jgi:hypothetical protein
MSAQHHSKHAKDPPMLKSIASKLVTLSAFAVLAGAIIASPANALNVANLTPKKCAADSPQITLTSARQVQGTGFCPSTNVFVEFEDSVSRSGFEGAAVVGFEGLAYGASSEYPTVSANGTFTAPFVYLTPPGVHATEGVRITANDNSGANYGEGTPSNTIIVTVPLPAQAS